MMKTSADTLIVRSISLNADKFIDGCMGFFMQTIDLAGFVTVSTRQAT